MKIKRSYPQPDSPEPHLGARERAFAVFKYLLDLEPEAAVKHALFACIVHAFEQHASRCSSLEPSLVPLLTSGGTAVPDVPERFVPDEGKL